MKLITYPNNSIQLRRYSVPMVTEPENPYETDVEYNPFDFQKVKDIPWYQPFPEPKKKGTSYPEENEQRSFNRTKQKVFEYARCVAWEWFVTFTFAPDKIDRYNFSECSKVIRKWLNNQRRNAPDLKYLIVPERHKDGAFHFHGLLADVGTIKFTDSGHVAKSKEPIYNMPKWANGFTTATRVTNIRSVSKYVGKYITKDLCCLTKGLQRYFVSSNLPKPEISTFLVDSNTDFEDLLHTISDSFGVDVVSLSTPRHEGAFVDVDYYELQERNTA